MNRISTHGPLSVVVIASALFFAGCGGSSERESGGAEKMFSDDRFALTFSYPDDLRSEEVPGVEKSVGTPQARVALALDSDNGIVVSKFEIDVPVTAANIEAAASEMDGVVAELLGRPVHGEVTELGGIPAVRYDAVPLEQPARGESRFVFVFDGKDQYQVNCQSTPEKRAEMNAACDRALASLRRA